MTKIVLIVDPFRNESDPSCSGVLFTVLFEAARRNLGSSLSSRVADFYPLHPPNLPLELWRQNKLTKLSCLSLYAELRVICTSPMRKRFLTSTITPSSLPLLLFLQLCSHRFPGIFARWPGIWKVPETALQRWLDGTCVVYVLWDVKCHGHWQNWMKLALIANIIGNQMVPSVWNEMDKLSTHFIWRQLWTWKHWLQSASQKPSRLTHHQKMSICQLSSRASTPCCSQQLPCQEIPKLAWPEAALGVPDDSTYQHEVMWSA